MKNYLYSLTCISLLTVFAHGVENPRFQVVEVDSSLEIGYGDFSIQFGEATNVVFRCVSCLRSNGRRPFLDDIAKAVDIIN